jgi:IS605 OrfB family transposase
LITIKLPIQNKINIDDFLIPWNNVLRFAYNRFKENPKLKLSDVEKIVKTKMLNIEKIDASLIKSACDKAKSLKDEKIIFGGKKNWYDYIKGLINKEEFKEKKKSPLQVRGSKTDNNGNRKFSLDIINNNRVIFKPKKGIEFSCSLPKLSNQYKKQLYLLEEKCNSGESCFTCSITNKHIYIIFDEVILKDKEIKVKSNRILSIDLNPNYIAYSICDYDKEDKINVIYKEIISLKEINDIEKTKEYKESENKKKFQNYISNKRRFEILEISKSIIKKAKAFNVESLVVEKLNIKSSEKGKGKRFNKLCNNQWLRNHLISNLKKRCCINGILFQEVVAQYSSFIGQMLHEDEYDSIAASFELGRRGNLYIRRYIKKESEEKVKIVFPEFNVENLSDLWKEKINLFSSTIDDWKSFYLFVKKSRHSYRLLFSEKGKFYRLNSTKSKIKQFCLM